MRRSRLGTLFAILIAFALIAAACGDDDDGAVVPAADSGDSEVTAPATSRRSRVTTGTWSTSANPMTT